MSVTTRRVSSLENKLGLSRKLSPELLERLSNEPSEVSKCARLIAGGATRGEIARKILGVLRSERDAAEAEAVRRAYKVLGEDQPQYIQLLLSLKGKRGGNGNNSETNSISREQSE